MAVRSGKTRGKDGAPGPRDLRIATTALVFLPILVAAMVGGLVFLGERESARALDARIRAAVRVTALQAETIINENLEVLQQVDARLGDDPAAFRSLAVRDAGKGGLDAFVAVFAADGTFLPAEGSRIVQNSIGENPDFRALADGAPWRITPLIALGPSGGRSFAIGHRIERNGRFAGAAVVYLSADLLVDSWMSIELGQDSTVGLIRDDGWLVTRFPVPAAPSNMADYELFTVHLARSDSGTYAAISPIDGIARRVAYTRVEGLPLIAVSSMSRRVINDGAWRRIQSTLMITAPVLFALAATCIGMILLLRRERRAQQALQAALAQNLMLFQEVHHRVKNNLQTVEAMIRLQPGPAEEKEELAKRIQAMSAVHTHMYESSQFETLRVDAYIETLAEGLRHGNDARIRVETRLDLLEMKADRAMTLGLLVNEVVLNAFKHAFPDGREGVIQIVLQSQGDGWGLLRIRDDGVGGADNSSRVGMGSRLIRGFARQLGGEPRLWSKEGTEFELRFEIG